MPQRTRSHVLEDRSLDKIRPVVTDKGWAVNDLRKDYGEDLLVRVFDSEYATPFSFYIQAKATEISTDNRDWKFTGEAIMMRLKREHFDAWNSRSEPVILVLWHQPTDQLIWECIQEYSQTPLGVDELAKTGKRSEPRKKLWLRVPIANSFNSQGCEDIRLLTIRRYARLDKWRSAGEIVANILGFILAATVEFDPEGGILLIRHEERISLVALNEIDSMFTRFEAESGEPAENLVLPFMRQMRELANAARDGRPLILRDSSGTVMGTYQNKRELEQALAENVGLRRFDYSFVEDALIGPNSEANALAHSPQN